MYKTWKENRERMASFKVFVMCLLVDINTYGKISAGLTILMQKILREVFISRWDDVSQPEGFLTCKTICSMH